MSDIAEIKLMTDDEFNAALEQAADGARRLVNEGKKRNFVPMLHMFEFMLDDNDGSFSPRMTVALLGDFNYERRHEHLTALGAEFGRRLTIVCAIFLFSEAWISHQEKGQPRKYPLPEDDPERQEIILIGGMTIDGRSNMARLPIRRSKRDYMTAGEVTLLPFGGEVKVHNNICRSFYRGFMTGIAATKAAMPGGKS